ncbi:MAG: hypothetical protein ABIZ96_00505 [Gemmatimonadales bacterium]
MQCADPELRAYPTLGALNLYQWGLFVGQHEARHAEQLKDIGRGFHEMKGRVC